MTSIKTLFAIALVLAAATAQPWAQTETPANASPEKASPSAAAGSSPSTATTAAEIQALKDGLAAQQLQIQRLTQLLERRLASQEAQQSATAAPDKTDASAIQTSLAQPAATLGAGSAEPVSGAAQQENPARPESAQGESEIYNQQMEGPLTIHFRGINITPGGYAAGEFVRRSRALAADMATPFNSLTMPGASQSQLPELVGSARQSKITTYVNGRAKNVDLSAYVSADFLSAGVTSTSTSTDSYTLRLRQAWGQVKFDDGWSFLAGQSWSLVTEDAKGISPDDDIGKTNDVRPKTIDSVYNVGFNYARQLGIRVTKSFGDKVALAFAVENPQATLTTHGNASNFLVGEAGASNSFNTTSTYSFNPSPDLIAKAAFDPGFGHYEVFGLLDRFADRIFPCIDISSTASCGGSATAGPNALGAFNSSHNGGGVGATTRWVVLNHHVDFGFKGFGGSGIGRYAPGGLPDVSVNADGALHLIKNLQGLGTIEFHSRRLDLYGYAGSEYASRATSFDPLANKGKGALVGYGAPTFLNTGCFTETGPGAGGFTPGTLANCTADTRELIEGTGGFWYRIYTGPRGRFQYGTQYSYVIRNTWSGVGGEPHGIDNMIFSSFRYYLP